MKDTLPEISYERSINHNYMILSKCDFFKKESDKTNDYRTRMLLENSIPGLLSVTHRMINGESRYYYEINSLQSLDRLYNKKEMCYEDLQKLLLGCVNLFNRLEEYLLDGSQIIIKLEYIYVDVEEMKPYFVCYPNYEGNVRLEFMEFIDDILVKIDHTDERAVMLGYKVYRYTRNPNYVISEISRIIEQLPVSSIDKKFVNEITNKKILDKEISDKEILDEKILDREEIPYKKTFNKSVAINDKDTSNMHMYNECKYDLDFDNINDYYSEKNYTDDEPEMKSKGIGDLIGGIFCVFVALCAVTIITGAKLLKVINLKGDHELYLYGAITMSVVASVLFFTCYIKKKKQDIEIENLSTQGLNRKNINTEYTNKENLNMRELDRDLNGINSYNKDYNIHNLNRSGNVKPQNVLKNSQRYEQSGRTVCLSDNLEERILYGRVNGKEVNISLDTLPMTIGKLANVSDFVINDMSVSKMHARIEEHDGKLYVCDLNSTNGTLKNGELLNINQPVALEAGDRVRFGRVSFTYC